MFYVYLSTGPAAMLIETLDFHFVPQILEVNGQNFENVPLSKANEILKNNTHLSITVKTNLLGKLHWLKLPQLHSHLDPKHALSKTCQLALLPFAVGENVVVVAFDYLFFENVR